jgi:hypothetical protein
MKIYTGPQAEPRQAYVPLPEKCTKIKGTPAHGDRMKAANGTRTRMEDRASNSCLPRMNMAVLSNPQQRGVMMRRGEPVAGRLRGRRRLLPRAATKAV